MRYYEPVTTEFLKDKMTERANELIDQGKIRGYDVEDFLDNWACIGPQLVYEDPNIEADLNIEFDMENYTPYRLNDEYHHDYGFTDLTGFKQIGDLTIYGMGAGGDWECALYFFFYWDGEKVRAYIPEKGNPYNTDAKSAYGNAETYDLEKGAENPDITNIRKRAEAGDFKFDGDLDDEYPELHECSPNPNKIKADIADNFERR
jgi:hypothetical protein